MKKIAICFLCLCLSVNLTSNFAFATSTEVPEETTDNSQTAFDNYHGIDAQSAMLGTRKLIDNITAGFLYEANSQTLLYAYEADKQVYPASLVKLMTALYAIENGNLEDIAVVSSSALATIPVDAVNVKLKVGEQMRLEDLLYCLLVSSANDAGAVIAEHISGDPETFVSGMNDYAQQLGCTNTTFTNPNGLHDEIQVTTARDMARILDAALKNEVFRKIFTSKTHRIEATNLAGVRKLQTSNSLLDSVSKQYYDARAIGGRSGVNQDGKRCMATAAESKGMLLISIVMGSESVYQEDGYSAIQVGGYKETTAMLDAGFKGYQTAQILYANQALQQCKVESGDCDLVVGPNESVRSVLPADATVDTLTYRYKLDNLKAPITKGDKISDVEIWSGSMCVGVSELYALNTVNFVDTSDAVDNAPSNRVNGSAIITWTIVGIVLGAFVCLFVVRYLYCRHTAFYCA